MTTQYLRRTQVGIRLSIMLVAVILLTGVLHASDQVYGNSLLKVQVTVGNNHIKGHMVELVRNSKTLEAKTTDAEGFVLFDSLEPGLYEIRIVSYWYPVVLRVVEVDDGINSIMVPIEDQGLTFAVDWDQNGSAATFSIAGTVEPISSEVEVTKQGIVGQGAAKTTGLYSFGNARDLINLDEGTIDFWTVVPIGRGFVLRSVANSNGLSMEVLPDRLEFQIFWHRDVNGRQINMMDFARMYTEKHLRQLRHVAVTWKSSESRIRIYVDGKEADIVRQRRITSDGTHEFITPVGSIEFSDLSPSISLGSRPQGEMGVDLYPSVLDQLSIRSVEFSPEEISADYAHKMKFMNQGL